MIDSRKNIEKRFVSAGTPVYYSLRGLSHDQKILASAIYSFYGEIENIFFVCQDPQLAQIKFNWWRVEVTKMSEGHADHPLMNFLSQFIIQYPFLQEKLLEIIDGVEQNFVCSSFSRFEDVVVHFMKTAGLRELLVMRILHPDNSVDKESIYRLMVGIELVNYLQYFRRYAQKDFILFPMDELYKFNVKARDFQSFKTTSEMEKLFLHQVSKVKKCFDGLSELQKSDRVKLSHLIIRSKIAESTLDEIQKSHFKILEQLITLTPLRQWWISLKSLTLENTF